MRRNPKDSRYELDEEREVFVYKNLHKNCWSIKQDGLVKAHTTELNLYNCAFKISKAGQDRVRKEKRKNVHAGIKGVIKDDTFERVWSDLPEDMMVEVTYNPYKNNSFVHRHDNSPRYFACIVKMRENYVLVDE